jgi:hypothetical protein
MKPIRHITLKSRQVGLSTLWILFWLDDTLFRPGVITGIMAHELDSLQHLASIVKFALDNMPFPVKLKEDNQKRISFGYNDSTILIDLEFRSTPLHNLHISEWAFCENAKIWATLAATSKTANITGESTGNGMGNDFYTTWMDSREGKNEYRNRFIPWFAHNEYSLPLDGAPEYVRTDSREKQFKLSQEQIHYRRQMMSKLKTDFFIEYPEDELDCWGSSNTMFFDSRKIIALAREAREMDNVDPPKQMTDLYTIWEEPDRDHVYVIGADPAEGIDGDYCAFKVLCCHCRREAMSFRGRVRIDSFSEELNKWGRAYNRCLLGVERNNHGHAVLAWLKSAYGYPNLYQEVKDIPIFIDLSKPRAEPKLGWNTTANSKAMMLDALKMAVEGDALEDENTFHPEFHIRDLDFLSECLTLQRNGVKLEATQGKHDDTVIATAIAFQMYLKMRGKLMGRNGLEKVMVGAPRTFT